MTYPEFGHIGFKIIATCWFYGSFKYMQTTIEQGEQRNQKNKILEVQLRQQNYILSDIRSELSKISRQ